MTASSVPLLLDTHAWVRYGFKTPPLRRPAIEVIDAGLETGTIWVSVISVWEIALLVRQDKLALHMSVERWIDEALAVRGLQLLLFITTDRNRIGQPPRAHA
jgi:PIN domain nuclease of toxin-antitoxin system